MGAVDFFFDIISFNTPLARALNVTGIFSSLFLVPEKMLIYSPFKCVFKYMIFPLFSSSCTGFGCNCPGCGLTRGMWKLLHGDIKSAVEFNLFAPIVFMFMLILLLVSIYSISRPYLPWKTRK